MSSHSMIYVGIYALIYLHTILHQGMDSRDGLPRGALPSGILKMEKYCPGHKVRSPILNKHKYGKDVFIMTIEKKESC